MSKKPSEYLRIKRHAIKNELIRIKGRACSRCGGKVEYNDCDFHHKNKKDFSFYISGTNLTSKTFLQLLTEAEKTELVHKTCHKIIHRP
jgi:hypothetical protein